MTKIFNFSLKHSKFYVLFIILSICPYIKSQQQAPVVSETKHQLTKILIPNLYPKHYQFYLKNHPKASNQFNQICKSVPNPILNIRDLQHHYYLHSNLSIENPIYLNDLNYGKSVLNEICTNIHLVNESCWGYENNCKNIYLMPECNPKEMVDKQVLIEWFNKLDFGFILKRRRELSKYCLPNKFSNDSIKSSLQCTNDFTSCQADNIVLKYDNLESKTTDNLTSNANQQEITVTGFNCDLQLERIQNENKQNGYLESWFNELNNFNLMKDIPKENVCDVYIDKTTFVIKLQFLQNYEGIYKYFYDFLNLYAVQHLFNKFSDDIQIIVWNNNQNLMQSLKNYNDFGMMNLVFSRNKLLTIEEFNNKRICFKKIIFSFLPETIDGIQKNMNSLNNFTCSKSGLFNSFSEHLLHKLRIPQTYDLNFHKLTKNNIIRITIVSKTTETISIINENELKIAIDNKKKREYQVNYFDFSRLNLTDQIAIAQNTDILIGINSIQLAISLFIPNWAALIEINNVDNPNDKTFENLCKLRGINYFSSNDKLKLSEEITNDNVDEKKEIPSNDKNSIIDNYKINIPELLIVLDQVIDIVKTNRLSHFRMQDLNIKESDDKEVGDVKVEKLHRKDVNPSILPQPKIEL